MKISQFQRDYQASKNRLDIEASFPHSHPKSRNAPRGVHSRHLDVPWLGSSLPMLTKGGSSVEEMGVDFKER